MENALIKQECKVSTSTCESFVVVAVVVFIIIIIFIIIIPSAVKIPRVKSKD